ncbi:MAG: PTS sugar transporter subunit IIA [Deltaproteobacteria bacterium]|nr:PTS sugar transporter subunit IIA [Deltaproteobacteria bacterium]
MFKGKNTRITDFLYQECIKIPQKEANTQLYVLARLSRFLNDKNFLKELSACKTGQKVIDVFTQYEKDDFS